MMGSNLGEQEAKWNHARFSHGRTTPFASSMSAEIGH